MTPIPQLVNELLAQVQAYNSVYRKSTQSNTLRQVQAKFPEYRVDYNDNIVRETLLEHVGHLPIIAVFLHPYLDKPVDLGKVLTMLAIHDIGELTTGDEITFSKISEQGGEEYDAALQTLHPSYHELYKEMDNFASSESKFVKSVDKMAPDIWDVVAGLDYTAKRLHAQAGWPLWECAQRLQAYKRPYMTWSPFLTEFHDELMRRFRES